MTPPGLDISRLLLCQCPHTFPLPIQLLTSAQLPDRLQHLGLCPLEVLCPLGEWTQSPDPDHLQPCTCPSFTPSTEPYLPQQLLLGTPPCAPCQVTESVRRLEPGLAPSHGGIQQTAPDTKHHPASPQRRSVLRRGALQSFTRHPPPTPRETECFPIPLVWEPSIDQPISSATRITHALHPHLQCPCWVSSSPAAVSAHMPSSLIGPSSPQVPGVETSSLLGPLPSPSVGPTCCLSLRSGTLPSSGMAQPVSGVPGGKVIRPSSLSKTPPNWENMG